MTIESAVRAIEMEFEVALGRPERVEEAVEELRGQCGTGPVPPGVDRLLPLLEKRSGRVAVALYPLIAEFARAAEAPWPWIRGLLHSREASLRLRSLEMAATFIEDGQLGIDGRVIQDLAAQFYPPDGSDPDPVSLDRLSRIVRRYGPDSHEPGLAPTVDLYLRGSTPAVRRLAADLLDRETTGVPPARAERMIGREAFRFLAPYLAYTQATHRDLLDLAAGGVMDPAVLESLRDAESVCGERLLREAIVRIGWPGLNLGLEAQSLWEIQPKGSLSFFLTDAEIDGDRSFPDRSRGTRRFRIVAHGGRPAASAAQADGGDAVARFRAYNLAHAEALAEILSLAPLTPARIARTRGLMDRIVDDFVRLFHAFDDECTRLRDIYADLTTRIDAGLEAHDKGGPLSLELTRLVQMFEDPRHLGEVSTLHGLKRYLHQKGLRLGFRLVEGGRATNRAVDLIVAGEDRILVHVRRIQYVDFEPMGGDSSGIPYAVRIAAEGFLHHLLYGGTTVPDLKVFCYGNEVHYYVSYGSHPAFLRIDFAPPFMGGMCDLEYYGVSKNELESHPAPDLPSIRQFFRRMEFHCAVARTRIHARYDKERARDLADLCSHAESLFRLVPHLMDLDWVIGSLRLDEAARRRVAEAWADRFVAWGVVPIEAVLTADRVGILEEIRPGPAGEKEAAWDGSPPYRDRFPAPPPEGWRPAWETRLRRSDRGGTPAPSGSTIDEAVRFAEILAEGGAALERAIRIARLVLPLERSLRFRTTGSVNGYEVQAAAVDLLGDVATCFVLRDSAGVARLALFVRGVALERDRCGSDPQEVATLLRNLRYLTAGADPTVAPGEADATLRLFREGSLHAPRRSVPGERAIGGVRAAPGRVAGIVRFGTTDRSPEELNGAILVAPILRPEDNTHLYHAAGIVTTGGGILSHAGLLALQFRKPAMMIPGRWDPAAPSPGEVIYDAIDFEEEKSRVGGFDLIVRRCCREREERLRDGDLAVLDVEEGLMRVLGQEPEAIALQEGLRGLADTSRRLACETDADRILALRGRRLRLLHQLERLFARLSDPVLIRHAIHEILFAEGMMEGLRGEKERLLSLLLGNPTVGESARRMISEARADLERISRTREAEAAARIPVSESLYEILSLRVEALRPRARLAEIAPGSALTDLPDLDGPARRRLVDLRAGLRSDLDRIDPERDELLRHRLRRIDRIDRLLGSGRDADPGLDEAREALGRRDAARLRAMAGRRILRSRDGGEELHSLIGSKAANLAEIERILGAEAVPPWFAVSDAAFRELLSASAGSSGNSLAGEIEAILRDPGATDRQRSSRIRLLWDRVEIPPSIAGEILDAYRALESLNDSSSVADAGDGLPYVAVRSSGCEEDTETASRAGEFETFLFVRGERELLDAIRRAWAGLWTARAIHNRAVFGVVEGGLGGGVLIQRICWSRVSGVLQTIHVADRRADEILINAGLGMGEGIVSGCVGADWVLVEKTGDLVRGPLRFRYVTADKREKVIFDARSGGGTIRVDTLYHERFRSALEYAEILELVRSAVALEDLFGIPLDIEFGYEGSSLRLLQVRPVGAFAACVQETVQRFPLGGEATGGAGVEG